MGMNPALWARGQMGDLRDQGKQWDDTGLCGESWWVSECWDDRYDDDHRWGLADAMERAVWLA